MRCYRVVIHEQDKPPFQFIASTLEPGEVWSVVVAALKMLDRERDWTLEIKHVPDLEGPKE